MDFFSKNSTYSWLRGIFLAKISDFLRRLPKRTHGKTTGYTDFRCWYFRESINKALNPISDNL